MAKIKSNTKSNINQQPISYKGEVILKLQKNGCTLKTHKINNSGTFLLFTSIARFLSGQFLSDTLLNQKDYIPNYLGVGYEKPISGSISSTDILKYSLTNEYEITRIKLNKGSIRTNSQTGTVVLPLTAVITYNQLGDRAINELGLFTTSTPRSETMLARIHLDPDTKYQLSPGMNWLIEWNIHIKNI